jgi:hypothetical protein
VTWGLTSASDEWSDELSDAWCWVVGRPPGLVGFVAFVAGASCDCGDCGDVVIVVLIDF